jgi:hypothetical protein
MCIACELGYLTMIDALEAERSALREREKTAPAETRFACEPSPDTAAPGHPPQSVDESTP